MGGGMLMNLASDGARRHEVSVNSITLFVALLSACIVIGHLQGNSRWMNKSIYALLLGSCTGLIRTLTTNRGSSGVLVFNEQLFFIYLLPPIIFNAGFQVKKKQFFKNFVTVILFGAVGTLISFSIISFGAKELFEALDMGSYFELRDYLAIGAIFAATDSVCTLQVLDQDQTPLLYSLVFGEGVMNDATSVVLFKAIQKFDPSDINSVAWTIICDFFFLFITSTLLGVSIGLLCACIIRKLYAQRHSTDEEVALMILMAYLSYMIAELFDLSGILTVFFCGIIMSHYTLYNITCRARVTTKHAFATMSFIAETFIFLYVGVDALDIKKWAFASKSPGKAVGASAALLGLVAVGRAAFVFPLSLLSNLGKSSRERLDAKQQITIWWAGLIRGAVSVALAYDQFSKSGFSQTPGNAITITCTITMVLFSTVVFGLLTKHFVRLLLTGKGHENAVESCSPLSMTIPLLVNRPDPEDDAGTGNVPRTPSLQMLLTTPTYMVHHYWKRFDNAFMRPMFRDEGLTQDFIPES